MNFKTQDLARVFCGWKKKIKQQQQQQHRRARSAWRDYYTIIYLGI